MKKRSIPKRIVYLLGAGSTQAEVDYQGGNKINLLMKDCPIRGEGVARRVLDKTDVYDMLKISNTEDIDVEKLISLLSVSNNGKFKRIAENLRKHYYEIILEGLDKSGVLTNPELAIGLLELHKSPIFSEGVEKLSGIIILNHDNLFQTASQKVYSCVNLGFKFKSSVISNFSEEETIKPPLLVKLYGSFDWRSRIPIEILKLDKTCKYSENMLWIPPSILKETHDYPYNKLAGFAYELLAKRCDILRIIGCSLSQNDWNVISLLFNAQYNQLLYYKGCFKVELIVPERVGEQIQKDCSYLQNLFPIGYLSDGYFGLFKGDERAEVPKISDLDNPYKFWLKTKTKHHLSNRQIAISTSGVLKKIMEEI